MSVVIWKNVKVINLKVVDTTLQIEFDFDPVCSKSIRPVKKIRDSFKN